jgi:hypothetical protein
MSASVIAEEIETVTKALWNEPGQQAKAQKLEIIAKKVKILEETLNDIGIETSKVGDLKVEIRKIMTDADPWQPIGTIRTRVLKAIDPEYVPKPWGE